jgi:hypothetical protein
LSREGGKQMSTQTLDPELERRIAELENPANQGASFGAIDWMWLIALGVALPAVILFWGWPS